MWPRDQKENSNGGEEWVVKNYARMARFAEAGIKLRKRITQSKKNGNGAGNRRTP